jgi:hypothetical protein
MTGFGEFRKIFIGCRELNGTKPQKQIKRTYLVYFFREFDIILKLYGLHQYITPI